MTAVISYCLGVARRCLMSSLIEELQRREAAARQEVDELRGEIARLNDRLARAEEALSRLEITRETVAEILGGAGAGAAGCGAGGGRGGCGRSGTGRLTGGGRLAGRGDDGAAVAAGPYPVGAAAFLPGPAGSPR